ncbi:MAG: chemotaxis response regulator protein-glutamate methylesterase [Vallitaleaceae bacterium]|nr:chemotaxis response regulator protein-glutamate methylesterase [Vallitaleaceae bacterium]
MNKRIRVLVLDDSPLYREVLTRALESDPGIEVVAKAVDPYDARDKLIEFEPDVMTCDIEMPKMNGIDFIRRLMPQYPLPVIVVSSVSTAVFDALQVGAVDFLTKPDVKSAEDVTLFVSELVHKVKSAVGAKIMKTTVVQEERMEEVCNSSNFDLIAIGASTGGTEAIFRVLKKLPPTLPGIVIVQHIPPVFSKMFAERLNLQTRFAVKEAQTGDLIEPGKIFVAPGDQHIAVKKIGSRYRIEAFSGEKVNGHCPSVDVLFESVAKECKEKAIGIILTGMGYDGSRGLLSMRRHGARTLGQDEASSVVYGMPKVAYEVGAVEKQCSLEGIPHKLLSFFK